MLILYLLIGINSIPSDTIISLDAVASLAALTFGHSLTLSDTGHRMDKNRSNVDGIDEYWCMNTDEMDKSWSTRQPHLPQLFQVYFYWLKGTGISHFLNSVGFPDLHGSWYSATPCSMDDGNSGKKNRASMSSWLYFGKCILANYVWTNRFNTVVGQGVRKDFPPMVQGLFFKMGLWRSLKPI